MRLDDILLGNFLASARKNSGLRQEDVAQTVSCSKNFVSLIERGRSPIPPKRFLEIVGAYDLKEMAVAGLFCARYPEHTEQLDTLISLMGWSGGKTMSECADWLRGLFDESGLVYWISLDEWRDLWRQYADIPKLPGEVILSSFHYWDKGAACWEIERWFKDVIEGFNWSEREALLSELNACETVFEDGHRIKKAFYVFPAHTSCKEISSILGA